MATKKPAKRGSKPAKKRSRKNVKLGGRTLAVAVYQREVDILDEAMKRQEELGSRATISSCIRYAINTVDFSAMPPIY